MIGVVLVSFCCIMFIHLGLGDAIMKTIHFDFILFRCQKCLNFWSVLGYTLFFTNFTILQSFAIAFAMSYIALWVDLVLSKIALRYDNWYEETEEEDMESESDRKERERETYYRRKGFYEEEKDKKNWMS